MSRRPTEIETDLRPSPRTLAHSGIEGIGNPTTKQTDSLCWRGNRSVSLSGCRCPRCRCALTCVVMDANQSRSRSVVLTWRPCPGVYDTRSALVELLDERFDVDSFRINDGHVS